MSIAVDNIKYDIRKTKQHLKECQDRLSNGVMPEWVDFLNANIKLARSKIVDLEFRLAEVK